MGSSEHIVKGDVVEFLLGGKCITTIQSKTGNRYTYQINLRKEDSNKTSGDRLYFVSIATGNMEFRYAGLLKVNIETREVGCKCGKNSSYTSDSKCIKGLVWLITRSLNNMSIDGLDVYHLGKCSRCGRPLTDPKSIELGIGPTCIGLTRKRYNRATSKNN